MESERTELTELVLDVALQVPPGRATTYGLVADAVRAASGHGTARHVGQVMSRWGGEVPWWRVVRADGTLPRPLRAEAAQHYRAEGTALSPLVPVRVDLERALWDPEDDWVPPGEVAGAVAEPDDA